MTDSPDISTSEIREELATRVLKADRGRYLSPKDRDNKEGVHLIKIGQNEEVEAIDTAIQNFREISHANNNYLDELSVEEIDDAVLRLETIKEKLEGDSSYKEAFDKLTQSHEEAHRMHEVRFSLTESGNIFEDVDKLQLGFYVEGGDEAVVQTRKSILSRSIYAETEATIAGLRNALEVDNSVKADYLFWRASAQFANVMIYTEKFNFDKALKHNYEGLETGYFKWVSRHYLADLMISLGNADLVNKIQNKEIKYQEFRAMAIEAMKKTLANPGEVLNDNALDPNFGLDIDKRLMMAVNVSRSALEGLTKIAETAEVED